MDRRTPNSAFRTPNSALDSVACMDGFAWHTAAVAALGWGHDADGRWPRNLRDGFGAVAAFVTLCPGAHCRQHLVGSDWDFVYSDSDGVVNRVGNGGRHRQQGALT